MPVIEQFLALDTRRKKAGVSRKSWALAAGIAESNLSRWDNGERCPKESTVNQLGAVLPALMAQAKRAKK